MNVTLQNISAYRNVERPNRNKIGKQLIMEENTNQVPTEIKS